MTYLQIAKLVALILLGVLIGSVSTWFVKDHEIQGIELRAAAEKDAVQNTLIDNLKQARLETKNVRDAVTNSRDKIQQELSFALDQNDDLRADLRRSISLRVKAPSCPAAGGGSGNADSSGTVQVEVADDVRQDLFNLRESILRDQAALKERDAWIAEVSKYNLVLPSPPPSP